MNVLVLHAHPVPDSFSHAVRDTAVAAMERVGHTVTVVDLYAEDFEARMSLAERRAYHGDTPVIADDVARHAALVQAADALVFVYPTWWFGLPAILLGWLDRVLVPGVGFVFDEDTGRPGPGLTNIRRIVGISTYGSSWTYIKGVNDAGRRTLLRTVRMVSHRWCRTGWISLYGADTADDARRRRFLAEVDRRMARL